MHPQILRYGIFALAFIAAILIYVVIMPYIRAEADKKPLWEGYTTMEYDLEGKKRTLVVADTASRWQKGLMFVRKPVTFDGMIFISGTTQPRIFWNRNTYVDLDVYWVKDDQIVGKSELPSVERSGIRTVRSPQAADTVIEIIK